jgi:uncharacterized protein (TIGR02599 family)
MRARPRHHRPFHARAQAAFSLVELTVAMAVLIMIMLVVVSLTNQVSSVWKRTTETMAAYEGARAADEVIAQNLAQATLNPYWDYDDPNTPKNYLRESELHFTCGRSDTLIDSTSRDIVSQAVFFAAPLGFVDSGTGPQLGTLLNGMGYFVEFGDDTDAKPPFLHELNPRYRFRLKQFKQRSEELEVYIKKGGNAWFTDNLDKPGRARTIAENVIALALVPKDPEGLPLTTDVLGVYNSRVTFTPPDQPAESNQLPPLIGVTMVILNETSALRLAGEFGTSRPSFIKEDLFADPAKVDAELAELETTLQSRRLDYRVLRTNVVIKGAKWSR